MADVDIMRTPSVEELRHEIYRMLAASTAREAREIADLYHTYPYTEDAALRAAVTRVRVKYEDANRALRRTLDELAIVTLRPLFIRRTGDGMYFPAPR